MFKIRTAILLAILLALLLPVTVNASVNTYYCTWYQVAGGDGSYDAPWYCGTPEALNTVVATVCDKGGGILYQSVQGGYYRLTIEWINQTCQMTSNVFFHGYPPDTGVALPAPMLIAGAAALGLVLVGGGLLLKRKRHTS
jgi:LPXTG-motif cell wall-anchored protein